MNTHDEGIFFNVPMEEYRRAPGINVSALKEIGISPRHYLSKTCEKQKDATEAQIIGTLTHSAVLENDNSGFVVRPDGMKFTTVEGKEWKAKQRLPIIDGETRDNIAQMKVACQNHPVAKRMLYGEGKNEVSCWRKHGPTGLLTKGRADRLTQDSNELTTIVDLKTTERGGASEREFSRSIFTWGYALQAAHYLTLFEATFFCFVVVEKESPFAVQCFHLSPDAIAYGRRKCDSYLERVKQCMDTGEWPSYPESLTTISLPEWVMKNE